MNKILRLMINFISFIMIILVLFHFIVLFRFFYIVHEKSDEPTDVIVVFTGGNNRIATALDLFQKKMASKVYISGLHPKTSIHQVLNKLSIKDVDKSSIFFDFAKNTEENSIETAKWVRENGIKSIRLVTSSLHMSRSYLLLSSELTDVKIIPHKVALEEGRENNSYLWISLLEEFFKFEYTMIKKIEKSIGEYFTSLFFNFIK
jgi:uncharacterized SAM-binding protein YcdF (DUF218 family)